jgi:AMP deaminase
MVSLAIKHTDPNRIDRYTRAAQTDKNNLTMSNLEPTTDVPQTPKSFQATLPESSNASVHTHPSATNQAEHPQQFSLPPGAMSGPLGPVQQARLNQSASTTDVINLAPQPTSPISAKESEHRHNRPRRSSSLTINPSIISAPQPPGASTTSSQYQPEGDGLSLTRTQSSVTLDGEPRIFPGVVSKNARRSSMRSSAVEDGSYVGFRQREAESVVEAKERDLEDEE